MNADDRFFVTESVRYSRSLPYVDCLAYLRGMLRSCGDQEIVADLRVIVSRISASDAQLELIAAGQLKLPFEPPAAAPRRSPSSRKHTAR